MIKKLETSLYVGSKISDYLEKNCILRMEVGRKNIYGFEKSNSITLRDHGKKILIEVSDKHIYYNNIEKIINNTKHKRK